MQIKYIKKVLKENEEKLRLLLMEKANLIRLLENAESSFFIKENKIRKKDVQGPPDAWFGTIWEYSKWVRENSTKKWITWNGRLYKTKDIISGKMPETQGRYEDL